MNLKMRVEAAERLDDLREAFDADLLTCYFLNPFSGFLWLFHRSGEFKYDCQMHGPLTLQEQYGRVHTIAPEGDGDVGYFFSVPPELERRCLTGKTFAEREEVEQVVRICFGHGENPAELVPPEQASVIVFLNYRDRKDPDSLRAAVNE